ncbi:MAG: hypothetical protein H0U84_08565 [Thermoleophilaceae bacterium]|nr:hypothetical protein [Thermoleophilaceae bacterium]
MSRGRLTIRNRTRLPDAEVKQLIRFAMEPTEPAETVAAVTHTRRRDGTSSGVACPYVPNDAAFRPVPKGAFYAIRLRVGKPEDYPAKRASWRYGWEDSLRDGWPLFRFESWQEALVAIAAHEAAHNELQRAGKSGTGELRAELFANEMLNRYREERGRP